MNIGSISVGRKLKKSFFDKTHDVNTTSDFGFCQPTMSDLLISKSSLELKTSAFVRLQPMPTPSFARVQAHVYNSFVPLSDVFIDSDAFIRQISVQNGISSPQIISSMDYVTNVHLLDFLLTGASLLSGEVPGSNPDLLAFPVLWKYTDGGGLVPFTANELNDDSGAIAKFVAGQQEQKLLKLYQTNSSETGYADDMAHWLSLLLEGYQAAQAGFKTQYSYLAPSFDNADFINQIGSVPQEAEYDSIYITYHLTRKGQRLYKVFRGLGVVFGEEQKIPLPLFYAYYKSWFELFAPQQTTTWEQTTCYYLINRYHSYPAVQMDDNYVVGGNLSDFYDFMIELTDCFYSQAVDPITVCQVNPWKNNSLRDLTVPIDTTSSHKEYYESSVNGYGEVSGTDFVSREVSPIVIRLLHAALPFVNKDGVIGRKIDKWMQVHYGQALQRRKNFGHTVISMQISDVLNTNSDGSAVLGEFAGKGTGFGNGQSFRFEADEFGYVIQFLAVVPLAGYSQSCGSALAVTPDDIYLSDYDSLGYEAVPANYVARDTAVLDNIDQTAGTFGFRPRFFGWKYKNNLRNGDFARRGRKPFLMPYCLDRYFTEEDYQLNEDDEVVKTQGIVIQASDELRFIGKSEDYGNYDRLFYNVDGTEDNFIVHMVNEYKLWSPMLPISKSFDTFTSDTQNSDDSTVGLNIS